MEARTLILFEVLNLHASVLFPGRAFQISPREPPFGTCHVALDIKQNSRGIAANFTVWKLYMEPNGVIDRSLCQKNWLFDLCTNDALNWKENLTKCQAVRELIGSVFDLSLLMCMQAGLLAPSERERSTVLVCLQNLSNIIWI